VFVFTNRSYPASITLFIGFRGRNSPEALAVLPVYITVYEASLLHRVTWWHHAFHYQIEPGWTSWTGAILFFWNEGKLHKITIL